VNERIRVREIRLIDDEGHQAGIVQTRDALQRAKEVGLDLIEVSPTAVPPVCRIMDYGKFKYDQAKREREAHKKSKQTELALIRCRPNIDDHDYDVKLRNARRLLEEGDKVRIFVIFRSREFTHPEFGRNLLMKFQEALQDIGVVEKTIGMEGRQMSLILGPKPKIVDKPAEPKVPKAPKVPKVPKAPPPPPPSTDDGDTGPSEPQAEATG
jgi:translation initiation factor IF-3